MSRKSSASLSIAPVIKLDARPSAPRSFTSRQKELWKEIVDSKQATWFNSGSIPLLSGYVRAITSYESLSCRVDKMEAGAHMDMMDENRLYSMVERQARLVQSFATKLRLTQQSRYTAASAAVASSRASGVRPWDESK
jgi:hypothetical protein